MGQKAMLAGALRLALMGASTMALLPAQAVAAETPKPKPDEPPADLGEVVVTGSRIQRDGYESPSPVAVRTAEELLKVAPGTLFEGLVEMPQFANTSTSLNTTHQNINAVPGTVFNLRGLGRNRTLVLMDGVRFAPTYQDGTVDVDIIPQLLVQRVETVTAGASAAYGSDAVAGVVNFILNKDFTGLRGVVQGGISSRKDYENYRLGLAYGRDLGPRTHFLVSAEYYENLGFRANERSHYQRLGFSPGKVVGSTFAPGTAQNPKINAVNTVWTTVPYTAYVASGPLAGAVLFGDGRYRLPAITGAPTGSAAIFTIPPSGTSDLIRGEDPWTQAPETRNATGFARLEHEFNDNLTGFLQLGLAKFDVDNIGHQPFFTGLRIFSGNPYIPSDLQARLTAANTASFSVSRIHAGLPTQDSGTRLFHYNVHAGFDGKLDRFSWNVRYQHAKSDLEGFYNSNLIATKTAAAVDAVREPGTGRIVCATSLHPDPAIRARYAGCIPFDPFLNTVRPDVVDYITGDTVYNTINKADIFTAEISGDLFNLWAGPVSAAVGVEYRKTSLQQDSNADNRVLYDIAGLRALTVKPALFTFNNVGVSNGSVEVKEIFGELAVPVLKDAPFAKSLELNGAVRYTDYSTSGPVTTWKAGLSWSPIDDVRVRVTRSRDIRAPSLEELFQGQTESDGTTFTDPHTRISGTTKSLGGGNPNLEPEFGDTLSYGVVLQPSALPGLALSVDYYDVKIKGAIFTLTSTAAAASCEASGGTSPVCAQIVRPLPFSNTSAANFPTSIRTLPINFSAFQMEAIDFEARHRSDVGPGALTVSLAASRLLHFRTKDSPAAAFIDYAGKNDTHFLPKWRGNLTINYQVGDWTLFLQEQFIGKVSYGPIFVYDEPDISPIVYTHLNISRRLDIRGAESEIFFNVRNLFDMEAPLYTAGAPSPGSTLDTQTRIYDVIGRTFTAGLRFRY